MTIGSESKTERIDIRTTASVKRLLQEAAAVKSKTLSDFLLDVALAEAAGVLAERRLFQLDDTQWAAFMEALDAPTRPRPRLEALMREEDVFE